ncbi:MAG: ABC transporter permease [Candidatus Sulfopaludibacter sp.]|nr:ABC transporter permease [Candidatus Sulfopaludibacter sp.]
MSLFRKLRDTFRSRRMDAELDDEFQFHLEQRVEHLVAQGASPQEARREAARMFGNRTHLRESTRDRNVLPVLQAVLQDLRFAARNMRQNPVFAAAAVLSLALGIGANTALFSVLDGLLLRLLPVEDPRSLVVLHDTPGDRFVYPAYELLGTHSRLLSDVAGIQSLPGTLEITDRGRAMQTAMQAVSGNYFQTLGVSAARGRTFAPGELHVAVISDRYWRAHYNSSPDAIGDRFQRLGWEYTVIGIAPPGFHGVMLDTPADIFIPLEDWIPTEEPFRSRGRIVSIVARMRPGVTPEQVAAEAGALLHRAVHVESGGTGISALRDRISRPLLVLDFLVAFVLLIACSNLAGLALASAASRQREMAVRQAIGAGRCRLVCQLLTESALLAVAGGTLAIFAAQWISRSLLLFLPPNTTDILPNLSFRPDAHVIGFAAALTLATCLLFGLAPALQATRSAPLAGLRQTPGAGHTSSGWLRRGLVICEVGLCTAVLMTAGLFVRTLHNLQNLDPAQAPERIVVANIPILRGYTPAERLHAFDTLRERAEGIPGVRAAGYIHVRPLTGHGLEANVGDINVFTERISPGFLAAMGIPLRDGRDFTARDDANSTPVAIVNELFVRRVLPGQSATGRRFRIAGETHDTEIVGVVKDTRWLSLREAPAPMLYRPFRQDPASFATLAVRTSGDPHALAVALQGISRTMHPPLPIDDIVPFTELENRALFTERMIAQVSAAFGVLALLIACTGLYGLLSYGVVRRTREIGIRLALGASRGGVQWLVLRESAVLLGMGIAVGLPAALAADRFAASLLFGLTATDPGATAVALAIMILTALAAACIPARRAVRVDPIAALREE